jgi:uncharacterized repeat protein (TIGR01451 family)
VKTPTKKIQLWRLMQMLLAGTLALLSIAVLSLLLSHVSALAQPVTEVAADLTVTKMVNTDYAAPGDTLLYTITINNSAASPVNAWMTDTLDAELVYISGGAIASDDFGFKDGVITWASTLPAYFGMDVITFAAQIPISTTATRIENTAQVTGTGELITSDPPAVTMIASPLDNEGTYKAVNRALAAPGDVLTYTIMLHNSGVNDVSARIYDLLPDLLTFITGSASIVPSDTGTLILPAGTVVVEPGSSVTMTFQAQVSESAEEGTLITNTAVISDGNGSIERSVMVRVNVPPVSQIRSPENGALITQKGTLNITGVAWDGTHPAFPTEPVLEQINNADGNGTYYVSWGHVPSALDYTLQEDDNPYFSSPTIPPGAIESQGELRYVSIEGKALGTYYYRVKARNLSGDSRWSNVESAIVSSAQSFSVPELPPASPALATAATAAGSITVEVSIEGGDWQTAIVTENVGGWWDWAYAWTLPEARETPYTLQTRARDAAGNLGAIDTITVTLDNKNYLMYMPIVFKRWPPVPYAPTLAAIENADGDGNYNVQWSYNHSTLHPSSYTLQEATNAAFTDATPIYNGSSTYYAVSGKTPATYYYRVQGRNSYGAGEWSNVVSVMLPPHAPTLNDISDSDGDGSYTVSWTYGYTDPPVTGYILQESPDGATFATVYNGATASYAVSDKASGTYYYRVQGYNASGYGAWSAVKSVTIVRGYYDDFSAATNWAYRRGDDIIDDPGPYRIKYRSGAMYMLFVGSYDFAVASPMEEAPAVPYTLRARGNIVKNETFDERVFYIRNGTTYGIVFGGNSGTPCPADRDTDQGKGCLSHYYRLMVIYNVHKLDNPDWQLKRIDYHDPKDDGKAKGVKLLEGSSTYIDAEDWNTWRIEVGSEAIKIYVNDHYLGQTKDLRYTSSPYFGLYMGSPDIGDTGIKWDWIDVK